MPDPRDRDLLEEECGDRDAVPVRQLTAEDLPAMAAIDARITGRDRETYLRTKLDEALRDTGVRVSLAADLDGRLAGFLLGRVYYGEFGQAETTAVLDTIGVDPAFRGRGVGRALLRQLRRNLRALGVRTLQTEVSWEDFELLAFFHATGFRPAARMCLDLELDR